MVSPTGSEAPDGGEGATRPSQPAPPRGGERGGSALRQRLDAERKASADRKPGRLRRLGVVAGGVGALVLAFLLLRAPVYRLVARAGGAGSDWAVSRLASLRDSESFDLYVEQLGRPEQRERYNVVVFQLAGREALPEAQSDGALGEETEEAREAHRDLLLRWLEDGTPTQKRGAVYALWTLKRRDWLHTPEVLERTADLLGAEDIRTRRYAAIVLTVSPAPPATWEALRSAAVPEGEPDPRVRRYAVKALGSAGDGEAHVPLLKKALVDPKQEVRRAATLALARLGAEIPLDVLEEMLRVEHPARRAEIVRAIARVEGPQATQLLVRVIDDPSTAARIAAAAGLADRSGVAARQGLLKALRADAPRLRIEAARAFAQRDDAADAVPTLVAALSRAEGWNELLAHHRALEAATGAEDAVPSPTPEKGSWRPVIEGWRDYLEGGSW